MTTTSGPGLALKAEAMGLAVMTELPLVVCNIQRAGPSTGMPTKTEQADLLQAMFGRNGESPLPIVAPGLAGRMFRYGASRPAAWRSATWCRWSTCRTATSPTAPSPGSCPRSRTCPTCGSSSPPNPEGFSPYLRDEKTLARPWAVPGTPGLEHRIGGLEKQAVSGGISYDPDNHELMTRLRAEKVERIALDVPELEVVGEPEGELLVIGWGSTLGPITGAVNHVRQMRASRSAAPISATSTPSREIPARCSRVSRRCCCPR